MADRTATFSFATAAAEDLLRSPGKPMVHSSPSPAFGPFTNPSTWRLRLKHAGDWVHDEYTNDRYIQYSEYIERYSRYINADFLIHAASREKRPRR